MWARTVTAALQLQLRQMQLQAQQAQLAQLDAAHAQMQMLQMQQARMGGPYLAQQAPDAAAATAVESARLAGGPAAGAGRGRARGAVQGGRCIRSESSPRRQRRREVTSHRSAPSPPPVAAVAVGLVAIVSAMDPSPGLVLVAAIENRAREVGVAVLSLVGEPRLSLYQSVDDAAFSATTALVAGVAPTTLLVCKAAAGDLRGVGHALQRQTAAPVVTLLRSRVRRAGRTRSLTQGDLTPPQFDDSAGALALGRLARAADRGAAPSWYLAMGASRAVLSHAADACDTVLRPGTLRVEAVPSAQHVLLDAALVQSLELVRPLGRSAAQHPGSLFALLNKTRTAAGARLLKTLLVQPLRCAATLDARLDALAELLSDEGLFAAAAAALARLPRALDRLLAAFAVAPAQKADAPPAVAASLAALLDMRVFLGLLPSVADALAPASSAMLMDLRAACSAASLRALDDKIGAVVDDDASLGKSAFCRATSVSFAVRAGVDTLLDVSRQAYCDMTEVSSPFPFCLGR